MTYSLEEKIKRFALYSRLGIIALQFVTNFFVPDHDAGVFQKPFNSSATTTTVDALVEMTLGGLTRWDGQYFLHIAHYGYTYENTLAFFPLFPLIIRQLSYFALFIVNDVFGVFLPVRNIISFHSCLILVSVFFNNFIFIRTSVILYKLSFLVLKSERLAFISGILFCVNPGSIFFSACYSESLYCFLIFYGLLLIEQRNTLTNYMVVGLTGSIRSNGLLNVGFLIYKYIKLKFTSRLPFFYNLIFALGVFVSIFPFMVYQLYCYSKFCLPHDSPVPDFIYKYGISNNFVFPGSGNSSWCNRLIPFAYAYVQKHYWNVGFLNYYEIKQIPNFLLASPMIYIIARGTFSFAKQYKLLLLCLGFVDGNPGKELPMSAFPYVVHGFLLTVFAVLMIHIQVTTRLLASSTPLVYWYGAVVLSSSMETPVESKFLQDLNRKQKSKYYESYKTRGSSWKTFLWSETFYGYSFFIKWYFLIYFFVGTLMFSNYLPWT